MLDLDKSRFLDRGAPVEFRDVALTPNAPSKHLISNFISFVSRQYRLIILAATIAVMLGGVLIFVSPVSYTANAKMIIDSRRIPLFQQPTLGDLTFDSPTIDSQAEILKSENIALTVIKHLGLEEDPEFTAKTQGYLSKILNFVGLRSSEEADALRRAVSVLKDNLTVRRVAQTYVIDIFFRSHNPDRAAQVANAVVDAYLVDFLEAKHLSNKRASVWLQERLRELRDDSATAQRAVVDFKARLTEAIAQSETTSQAQVQLRELESTAQSYRTLYDSFLQKQIEAVQQQSYPVTETRLITHATRPNNSSHPKVLLILAMSALGGIACGFGAGALREILDRAIRTTDQLETALGLQCLAVLPVIKSQAGNAEQRSLKSRSRRIERTHGPLWVTVEEPLSRFTEGVRAIKVAIDLEGITKGNKVIGITSTLPNEGKSTVATNLAQLIAHAGQKVILIDGDLRNPALTRALAPGARAGLVELVSDKSDVSDVVWTDHSTNMQFVPIKLKRRLEHTNEFMASDAIKAWFSRLRQNYDYVIVDLPPLAPVVDVRSSAHLMDSIVFVVEWGVTNVDVITHSLHQSQGIRDKVMGTALNKVDMTALRRFENNREDYYSDKYYSRYALHD